jgi:hypothetical protein
MSESRLYNLREAAARLATGWPVCVIAGSASALGWRWCGSDPPGRFGFGRQTCGVSFEPSRSPEGRAHDHRLATECGVP